MKTYLFIFTNAPYQDYTALESLELALAISSFDQRVTLFFGGAGATQLLAKQPADAVYYKEFTKSYSGLRLFDINDVYVDQASLAALGNAELLLQPQVADAAALEELVQTHDVVIRC